MINYTSPIQTFVLTAADMYGHTHTVVINAANIELAKVKYLANEPTHTVLTTL